MKNIYTAYTREVNSQTCYFVKKFILLPEYEQVAPILESLGMHRDFMKACDFAGVESVEILEDLMKQLDLTMVSGKVIPMHQLERKEAKPKVQSLFRNTQNLLQKLRLAHI